PDGRTNHRARASLLPRGNTPKLDSARRFTDLFGLKGAQVEQQVARRLVPVGGILLKTAEDEGPQPGRYLFRLGILLRMVGEDGRESVDIRRSSERPSSRQHIVEDRAQREDVAVVIATAAPHH